MPTPDTILNELKNVPLDKLKDLYSIIHSLQTNTKKSGKTNRKILSFAASFGDISESDFKRIKGLEIANWLK